MTLEHLLTEGHRLALPIVLLCPGTSGEPFANWHEGAAEKAAGPERRCGIIIWYELLDDWLPVLTLKDRTPWVKYWQSPECSYG
jgi:hypothetical protein